jgi:hypothetical protein
MESARWEGAAAAAAAEPSGEPTISFSYLSQLKVAMLISAAREASGIKQAASSKPAMGRETIRWAAIGFITLILAKKAAL